MEVSESREANKLSKIIQLGALELSICKILVNTIVYAAIILAIVTITSNIFIGIAVAIKLLIIGPLLLWSTDSPFLVTLFFTKLQASQVATTFYSITDTSSALQYTDNYRSLFNKSPVVKPIPVYKDNSLLMKVFKHRGNIYRIKDQNVSIISEKQILSEVLAFENIQHHAKLGMSQAQIDLSQKVFGRNHFSISSFAFFIRRLKQEKYYIIFSIVLLIVAQKFGNSIFMVMLVANVVNLMLVGVSEHWLALNFQKMNTGWYENCTFSVKRNDGSPNLELKVDEILVGDVINLRRSFKEGQTSLTLFCKGVLSGRNLILQDPITKQLKMKLQLQKPERQLIDHQGDIRNQNFIVQAETKITIDQVNGEEELIVTEHDSILKYFSLWMDHNNQHEFQSILLKHKQQIAISIGLLVPLYLLQILILILFYLLAGFFSIQILFRFEESLKNSVIFSIGGGFLIYIGCSLMHEMYVKYKMLESDGIIFTNNSHLKSGLVSDIAVDFESLLTLCYDDIIYKFKIFDQNSEEFEINARTFDRGNAHEFFIALMLYITMGQYEPQDYLLHSCLYQQYKAEFQVEVTAENQKDIKHIATKKSWYLQEKISTIEEPELIKKWLVKYYQNDVKYIIVEGTFQPQPSTINYLRNMIEFNQGTEKTDAYLQYGQQKHEQGKIVKYICFQKLKKKKEDRKIPGNDELRKTRQRQSREERNYSFAGFILYDNGISKSTTQTLQKLTGSANNLQSPEIKLYFLSSIRKEQVLGFQHIFKNQLISYESTQQQKIKCIREIITKKQNCSFVGDFLSYQPCFLLADVGIKVQGRSRQKEEYESIGPCDVYIPEMSKIEPLLGYTRWSVDLMMLTVKCILLMVSAMIISGIILNHESTASFNLTKSLIECIVFLGIPLILLNLTTAKMNSSMPRTSFLDVGTILHFIISLTMLVFIVGITYKQSNCYPLVNPSPSPISFTVRANHHQNYETITYNCQNYTTYIISSFSFLIFGVLCGPSHWRGTSEQHSMFRNYIQQIYIGCAWLISMVILDVPLMFYVFTLVMIGMVGLCQYLMKKLQRQ